MLAGAVSVFASCFSTAASSSKLYVRCRQSRGSVRRAHVCRRVGVLRALMLIAIENKNQCLEDTSKIYKCDVDAERAGGKASNEWNGIGTKRKKKKRTKLPKKQRQQLRVGGRSGRFVEENRHNNLIGILLNAQVAGI